MQRDAQVCGVEHAQAQELERARAQGAREHARRLVVELDGERAVEQRELLHRDPGRLLFKQCRGDAGAPDAVERQRPVFPEAVEELADHADRHGDGRGIQAFGHGSCDAAVHRRDVSVMWQEMSIDRPDLPSTTRPVLPSMACK